MQRGQLAERLANGPAATLGLMKRSFELGQHAAFEQTIDYEAQAQEIAGASAEYARGGDCIPREARGDIPLTQTDGRLAMPIGRRFTNVWLRPERGRC